MAARLTTYVVVGIVAATLIAGLIVGAQRDDYDGPVDLIVHNGRVFTADKSGTIAEAIAVRGNQVLRVGSNRDINRLKRPQTIVIDANGAAVLPGFNDSHVHFIDGGLALDTIDLAGAGAIEVEERVRTWAEANVDREWVIGRGLPDSDEAGAAQPRQTLDAIVADRPALLLSADGSTAWANSRALALARVDRRTADPAKGTIVKDPRTGEPTGVLKGTAVRLVTAVVPQPSAEDRARALRLAIAEAHRHGITSIHNASTEERDLELYEEARKAGDLKVRVHAALPVTSPLTEAELDRLDAIRTEYPDDPLFKTGALKMWIDGAPDAGVSLLLGPDGTRASTAADPAIAPDDLNRSARLADARGWQILMHAANHGAVHMALDAYEHAARSNLPPPRGRRHRIEHPEAIDADDVARFGRLGVLASVHPLDPPRSVEDQTGVLYRSLTTAGGRVTFGSEWPASSMNPLLGLHAAVTGRTLEEEPDGRRSRDERLALKEALMAYTSVPAWASFDEHRKGTLAPGMLADIVVLSKDIFDAPPAELAATSVEVTIFDGKIVYRRGARPDATD